MTAVGRVLPWVLLVLVGSAWLATVLLEGDASSPEVLPERIDALEQEVARLREEADGLREAAAAREPALRGSETAKAPAAAADTDPRMTARAEAKRARAERRRRMEAAYALAGPWIRQLRSVGDRRAREDAIVTIRAALESDDPDVLLAGLVAARALGHLDYDRDDFRAALLEHVHREDQLERRAARETLSYVNPQPEDVAMWAQEALVATNEYAETVAGALVSAAGRKVDGEVEDAVLHMLRDGTDINRAHLLRGLQCAQAFSPDLEARLIELVRGKDGHGSGMTHFFYHFLGDKFRPMSEAMFAMVLGHLAIEAHMELALRSLQAGLSDDQMERVAARLLDLADSAGTEYQLYHLFEHFRYLRGHGDADRLQAFADDEELPREIRELAARVAEAARQRPRR